MTVINEKVDKWIDRLGWPIIILAILYFGIRICGCNSPTEPQPRDCQQAVIDSLQNELDWLQDENLELSEIIKESIEAHGRDFCLLSCYRKTFGSIGDCECGR